MFLFALVEVCRRSDPPQAENPAKQDFFLRTRKYKHGKVLCRAGVKDMESGMKINAVCFETRNQRQNETSCLTE